MPSFGASEGDVFAATAARRPKVVAGRSRRLCSAGFVLFLGGGGEVQESDGGSGEMRRAGGGVMGVMGGGTERIG